MIPYGKHLYFWDFANFQAHGYTYADLTTLVRRLGVVVVAVKMANGYQPYLRLQKVLDAIRAGGAQVAGWHYYYSGVYFANGTPSATGITPQQEAAVSLQMIEQYQPVYWLMDCEREFKVMEQNRRMAELMHALRPHVYIPLGISSYRYPQSHPDFPWREVFTVDGGVDFNYPQVYWNRPTQPNFGPVVESNKSFTQFQALYKALGVKARQFYPTGRAYVGDQYAAPGPSGTEMFEFIDNAHKQGWPGVSFWSADALVGHPGGQARIDAIAAYQWGEQIPAPTVNQFTISVDGCNLRREPTTAAGAASVIGHGEAGGTWEVNGSTLDAEGRRWYKIQGYVREDMGNAG